MPQNEPLKSVENIVQLQSARRAFPVPALLAPRAQPTPAVLFTGWVATRDRLAAALLGGTTRVLLTGPAGTGKTVLVEHVARVLRAAGRTVIIQLADADPAPPGPGVTLIVDEADRLTAAKLRHLFDDATGTVVLTGLAPLARRVASGTMQLTLEPLGPADAQEYIAEWLALNGRTPAELDSQAVRVLVALSGGVPRLLSTLLAAGAWLARNANAPIIQAVHIQEAAELRSVVGPPAAEIAIVERKPVRPRRVLWSALLTSVVLVGTAAVVVPRLFPAETDQAIALAGPFLQPAERWLRAEPSRPLRLPVQQAAQTVAPVTAPGPIEAAPEPASLAAKPEPAPVAEPVATPEPPKSAVEIPKSEPAPEPALPVAAEPVKPVPEPAPAAPEASAEAAPTAPTSETSVSEPVRNDPVPAVKQPEISPVVAAIPPPAAVPAAIPSPALPIETVEFLLRRGREMLAIDDLSAARLLFTRAAEGGSPEAMFELGQTFDPAFLTSLGTTRQADRAEALRWYRRAAANGNRAAERLLPKP